MAPYSGWDEVDLALQASTEAFPSWSSLDSNERQAILLKCSEAITFHKEEFARTMALEIGKPIALGRAELDRTAITFRLASKLSTQSEELDLSYDMRGNDYRCSYSRVPIGPVLGIVPYNWPFNLAAHKIAPALAAGCTIVVKPSPFGAISTFALTRLLNECGLPQGVVTSVLCSNEDTQRAALDPRIKMLSFTGSERVGWHLKGLLPEKPVLLELGGDAACIVFEDADLEFAAHRIALGAFGYAGQVCISAQHAYVLDAAYDTFLELMTCATENTPTGDPMDEKTVCGPVINSESADRIMSWITEAETAGARVLAGGSRIGNTIEPTLIEGVPLTCSLATEEVFGPILTMSSVKSEQEAVAKVNSSRFGIHCSVFTCDRARIQRCRQTLDVGGVIVNDFPNLRFDSMPYGGNKRSGFGREGVRFAFDEMTTTRVLLERTET